VRVESLKDLTDSVVLLDSALAVLAVAVAVVAFVVLKAGMIAVLRAIDDDLRDRL
jgi:hypothetical protein